MKHTHTEKKRHGSVLDIFLVFLLLFSVLGIFLRSHSLKSLSASEEMRKYVAFAVMESVDPRLFDCLEVGEPVFTAAGETWGRVSGVSRTPAKTSVQGNDGAIVQGVWEETRRCDLLVEILFEGNDSAGRVLQNGKTAVLAGQRVTLYSHRVMLSLRILKIADFE